MIRKIPKKSGTLLPTFAILLLSLSCRILSYPSALFTLVITIQRLFSDPIFLVLDFLHSRQQVILTLFKRSSVPGQYIYKKDGMSIYKDVSNDNLIDTFSSNLIKVKINHSLIKERWKFDFPLRIFLGQTTNQPTNQPTYQQTDKASYRVACPQLKSYNFQYSFT